MERAQEVLLGALANSADSQRQKLGEDQLNSLSREPGFGVVLVSLLINRSVEDRLRQLSALILRQWITQHWDPDAEEFQPPIVSDGDKEQIRRLLPQLLADPMSKLRTAASMAIAAIGAVDFPERWPSLLENLIGAVGSQDANLVQGGLRCLVLFVEDITDVQLSQTIPPLFPVLLRVCAAPGFPVKSKMRAIAVFRVCTSSLLTIAGGDEDDDDDEDGGNKQFEALVTRLLQPTINEWFRLFHTLLDSQTNPDGFSLPLESVRSLKMLQRYFPTIVQKFIGQFLKPLWGQLVFGYKTYVSEVLNGEGEEDEEYDDEGDLISISSFLFQALDFFCQLLDGSKKFKKLFEPQLSHLCYQILGYMQMTSEDLRLWEEDPGEYVAVEDDFIQAGDSSQSVRVGGQMLLLKLVECFGEKALAAIIQESTKRIAESTASKAEGYPHWWKLREASMFAIGLIADEITPETHFDMQGFVQNMLVPDLDPTTQNLPYLKARAIWCLSHFAPVFEKSSKDLRLEQFALGAITSGLEVQNALPVRLGAARAFGMLCVSLEKEKLIQAMPKALTLTCELMSHASDSVLHVTLDTLILSIGIDVQVTASLEPQLTPMLLRVWGQNASDRLVTEGVIEILEKMVQFPQSLAGVQAKLIPVVLSILNESEKHYSGTVESSLDLLNVLVIACGKLKVDLPPALLQNGLPAVLNQVLTTQDHSVLESGCLCLTSFLRVAVNHIQTAQINGTPILSILCQALARLLSPDLEDSAAHSVGGLVTQVVFKLSEKLGSQAVSDLLKAVVIRLYNARFPPLAESLLLVFARLVHAHGVNILNFLQTIGVVSVALNVQHEVPPSPGESTTRLMAGKQPAQINALEFVLQKWVLAQDDFHATYPTKVSLTALAKLLMFQDARIQSLSAQGYPIEEKEQKVRKPATRRNKQQTARFTTIPLPSKIVSVMLKEWREQCKSAKDKEAIKAGTADSGSDIDDDDDEDEGVVIHAGGKSKGKSPFVDETEWNSRDPERKYIDLSELCDDSDEEAELMEEAYPEMTEDPLNNVDLRVFVVDCLKTCATQHKDLLVECARALNQQDQASLQQLLSS